MQIKRSYATMRVIVATTRDINNLQLRSELMQEIFSGNKTIVRSCLERDCTPSLLKASLINYSFIKNYFFIYASRSNR